MSTIAVNNHKKCCFELWNKEAKGMVSCGKDAAFNGPGKGKYLCKEHGEYYYWMKYKYIASSPSIKQYRL